MPEKLVTLKNVSDGTVEYFEPKSGRLYSDPEGANLLRVLREVEFLEGPDKERLFDSHGRKIHLSHLANAAAEHNAAMTANSLGCDVQWTALSINGHKTEQLAKPNNARGQNIFMRGIDGKMVAMDLAITDVHTPAALPNYAAGYHISPGIADQVSPVIPVVKQSDVYNTWNTDTDFKRKIPNASAPGADVPMVNPALVSPATYVAEQYALGGFITTEVQTNADVPLQPWQKLMQMVVDALRLEREIRVANLVQTSANWQSSLVNTLASGAQWNGGASADPIANFHLAEEQSYMDVDGFALAEVTLHDFLRSPAVQKYTYAKAQVGALPSLEEIAKEFGLPPIYVGRMKYVTGGVLTYVWGNHVVGLHRPSQMPPTDQMDVATSVTFRWNGGTTPDGTITGGFLVRSFWDPKRGPRGATVVVVTHNDAEVMTSGYVGSLILNAHR